MTQARHYSYSLFSQLFLEGITAVTLPIVQSIPELAGTLPVAFEPDQAAAEHQAIFGFNVFPFESFFLDKTGLIGGSVTEAVARTYREAGFQEESSATSPDHIGHELAFVAHLLSGDESVYAHVLLSAFMQQHLLCWLPSFVLAVYKQGNAFYAALSGLMIALITDHVAELGLIENAQFQLPAVPTLLQNDKTNLKDISEFLTTPAYCGIYLGREDVARLARQLELPRGFGSRSQMLTNLMKTAVQYEQLPAMITTLQKLLAGWRQKYRELSGENPPVSYYAKLWEERAGETAVLLSQMEHQIQQSS